jgi:UV DNA damage endonuclease
MPPGRVRQPSTRTRSQPKPANIDSSPDINLRVVDGQEALSASPDAVGNTENFEVETVSAKQGKKQVAAVTPKQKDMAPPRESSLFDLSDVEEPPSFTPSTRLSPAKKNATSKAAEIHDLKADDEDYADPEEISAALSRPPPVNSSYLPLPWKGRLGYACLCTYLRASNPPVFSSRTCRIASILEYRHPLKDPS